MTSLTENVPNNYYTAQTNKLLKDFDKVAKHYRNVLKSHLGDEAPDEIIRETRQEFQRLIPEIPYIGGKKNGFTRALIGCTMALALYRVLKSRVRSVEEIGKMVVEVEENRVQSYPKFFVRLLGRFIHSPLGKNRIKKMAEESQKRLYPGGWVATFVESDGEEFDFGIDYTECGLCKFFHQQGADEFTPYLCLIDFVQQRAMNTGFSRSMTLAEGADRCDFRWKKGKETRPAWPPPWIERSSIGKAA
ncbi:MAG: L-2-amino-thiazoline-4-carboxylic acid hydrolase [Anaerolineae bacterium]|nr:L-2-amino-thiazoline-4-carboxylic acid hydrolase [Anaerolineae bacterium]